ncbi:hypothetical protein B0H14DRAFT_584679 [Mycena olivaceomarginata]|nr:hypothetical protein B0H14DRAFT_584679 [Mycena olivaceomarginata]
MFPLPLPLRAACLWLPALDSRLSGPRRPPLLSRRLSLGQVFQVQSGQHPLCSRVLFWLFFCVDGHRRRRAQWRGSSSLLLCARSPHRSRTVHGSAPEHRPITLVIQNEVASGKSVQETTLVTRVALSTVRWAQILSAEDELVTHPPLLHTPASPYPSPIPSPSPSLPRSYIFNPLLLF